MLSIFRKNYTKGQLVFNETSDCNYFYVIYIGECLCVKKNELKSKSQKRMLMTSGNIFGLESLNNIDIYTEEKREKYESLIESHSETTLYRICIEHLRYIKMVDVLNYLIGWKRKTEKCRSNILKSIELNFDKLKLQPKYSNSELKNMTNIDYKKNHIQSFIEKEYSNLNKAKSHSKVKAMMEEKSNTKIDNMTDYNIVSCRFPSKMSIFNLKTSANFTPSSQTPNLRNSKMQETFLQSPNKFIKENSLPNIIDTSPIKSNTFRSHCASICSIQELDKFVKSNPTATFDENQIDKEVNISINLINVVENETISQFNEYAQTQGNESNIQFSNRRGGVSQIASISSSLKKEMKLHFHNRFIKNILADQSKTPRNTIYFNPIKTDLRSDLKTKDATKSLINPQNSSIQALASPINCSKPIKITANLKSIPSHLRKIEPKDKEICKLPSFGFKCSTK